MIISEQKTTEDALKKAKSGVLLGLAAYTIWGSFPIFFKALHGAPPLEIVAHRILWSSVFLATLVIFRRQTGIFWQTIKNRSCLLTLCASTLLIAANWLTFLFAIQRGEVLQSSLGYFITPLISVLLGFTFLKERLNRLQATSVLIAFLGVMNLTIHHGEFPWISLVLAFSFGLYGLLRKLAQVEAMVGLTIETLLLAPLALLYILLLHEQHSGTFLSGSLRLDLLLPLSGIVTAVPLLAFVGAARRLRMATIGFLQYITPSLHFLLAVLLYKEPFSSGHLVSFICIWTALGLYSVNALRRKSPA